MTGKKKSFGDCPYCGKFCYDSDSCDFDGERLFRTVNCSKCGKEFIDIFRVIYDGYATFDEDGDEIPYDKDGNQL